MRDLLEGMLLPFKAAWLAICYAGRGIAVVYRCYMALTSGLSPKAAGLVHSTVFLSLGQGIAMLLIDVFSRHKAG